MTRKKEPAAQGASARRAVAKSASRTKSEQMALPLRSLEGTVVPASEGEHRKGVLTAKEVGKLENISSREENTLRRQRIKSPISVTTIKRVLAAACAAGMKVISLEVRPDGTILVGLIGAANDDDVDVFDQWADRL